MEFIFTQFQMMPFFAIEFQIQNQTTAKVFFLNAEIFHNIEKKIKMK